MSMASRASGATAASAVSSVYSEDLRDEEAWSGDEEVPLRIDPNSVWGGLSLPGGQRADCLSLARVRARGVLG